MKRRGIAVWAESLRAVFEWRRHVDIRQGDRVIRIAQRHAVYLDDVRRYFNYYWSAVESQDGLVDYSRPTWHTLRPSGDRFRFTGLAEPEETTAVYLDFAALQPGDLVVDAGAYCGGSTIAFARAVGPFGHVLALEPDPANRRALTANVAYHRIPNVTVRPWGLWRTTGRQAFAAEGNMGSAVASVLPRPSRAAPRPMRSLADVCDEAVRVSGLPIVAFVKLDIEGAEVPVLESARAVLRAHRPRLAIEPHFDESGTLTTEACTRLLTESAYACHIVPGVESHPMLLAEPR